MKAFADDKMTRTCPLEKASHESSIESLQNQTNSGDTQFSDTAL